jgi:hypothetical protein
VGTAPLGTKPFASITIGSAALRALSISSMTVSVTLNIRNMAVVLSLRNPNRASACFDSY